MQINLTLLIQILNVFATILMLRQIFWPQLLQVIATEDQETARNSQSCQEVRLELQALAQAQEEKEALLARSINTSFKQLEDAKSTPHFAMEKNFLEAPANIKENVTHKATADKLASLLQKKF